MSSEDLLRISLARRACDGDGRRLRLERRLSLREVARFVGCDPASISRYERGKARPSGERAARYGELIADWLLADKAESETAR